MIRILLKIHRYLGIGVGAILLLWCLSAFVMMYVQYPDLNDREYLLGLQALDTSACCRVDDDVIEEMDKLVSFSLEMLAGTPTLRTVAANNEATLVDLTTGQRVTTINQQTATLQAQSFLLASGITGNAEPQGPITRDQWTVAGYFNAVRPFYLFHVDDELGTELYVSQISGEIVQVTTAHERFWNWFGSVTHWIYPAGLRKNVDAWSQVVIWLTIASLFLVVIGLYLGIRQLMPNSGISISPYKGLVLWHHYSGLVFGLLTLTWLFSGLLSMNPWGLLSGTGVANEQQLLGRRTINSNEFSEFLNALQVATLPADTVKLRSANMLGEFAVAAYSHSGNVERLDGATLQPKKVRAATWDAISTAISMGNAELDSGFIDSGDNYYYSHHEQVALPVYRVILDNDERTHFYFDADTAELIDKVDSDARWSRWLFLALHRGDFSALIRQRPLWDVLLLILLAGVTVGSVTGLWLGVRRLRR